MTKPDIDSLLKSNDPDSTIDKLYTYISELCSQGNDLSNLTEHQKNFFFMQDLERGVRSGDFHDYFYASSGRFAHEALAALDMIGAELTIGIVSFAMSCFSNEQVPKDDEQRRRQLVEMSSADKDVLRRMTQTLYENPEELNHLCFEYVQVNKSAF